MYNAKLDFYDRGGHHNLTRCRFTLNCQMNKSLLGRSDFDQLQIGCRYV